MVKKTSKKKATKKKVRKKKSSSKKGRRKSPAKTRSWKQIFKVSAIVLLVVLVLLALWIFFHVRGLNEQVRTQFEGKRWELAARVYARPLELYPAKVLNKDQLSEELELLGYRAVTKIEQPGEYVLAEQSIEVYLRAFPFPDETSESTYLRVNFKLDKITTLTDVQSGEPIYLLRVEPALIANIYPKNNEDRVLVQRAEAPELLIQALLTIEDQKFYQHHGVRPTSILRALLINIRAVSYTHLTLPTTPYV